MMTCGAKTMLAGLLIGAATCATPALAQQDDGDIIVTGRGAARVPDSVRSLSLRVDYRDLDIRYDDDWRELRRRVTVTARYLCNRLGESSSSSSVVPSCQKAAVSDAMRRIGTSKAGYVPRGTTWVGDRTGW